MEQEPQDTGEAGAASEAVPASPHKEELQAMFDAEEHLTEEQVRELLETQIQRLNEGIAEERGKLDDDMHKLVVEMACISSFRREMIALMPDPAELKAAKRVTDNGDGTMSVKILNAYDMLAVDREKAQSDIDFLYPKEFKIGQVFGRNLEAIDEADESDDEKSDTKLRMRRRNLLLVASVCDVNIDKLRRMDIEDLNVLTSVVLAKAGKQAGWDFE